MIKIEQISSEDALLQNYNLFIVASGFEKRATLQGEKYSGHANRKIALAFNNERDDVVRLQNDEIFHERGFEPIILDGEETDYDVLKKIIQESFKTKQSELNIYIDYSSMTKNWYAYILYFIKNSKKIMSISITFGYSHAKYLKYDGKDALNRVVSPLIGYCNINIPSKPTALIICAGNEPNRVYGIKDYFDAEPYLFYTDSSFNIEYHEETQSANIDLLSEIKQDNIIRFPVYDLMYTNNILENLCKSLINKFRIIIAPCGPKPFALLSMIISLNYEGEIEIWRISPGDGVSKTDREPEGLITCLKVIF